MPNLLTDVTGAVIQIFFAIPLFWILAKRLGVSRLPVAIVAGVAAPFGLLLYLPISPIFVESDATYYQEWGVAIANSWSGSPSELAQKQIWPGKGIWPLIIAVFYSAIGPSPVSLIIFNTLLLSLMVLLLQKAVLVLTSTADKWVTPGFVVTAVPFMTFGPSILRESFFWVGIGAITLGFCYLHKGRQYLGAANVAWGSVLVLAIRPDAGLLIVLVAIALFVITTGILVPRVHWAKRFVAIVVLFGLIFSFSPLFKLVRPETTGESVSRIADALQRESTSAFKSTLADENRCEGGLYSRLACQSIQNLPRAFLGPFPWEFRIQPVFIAAALSTFHFILTLGFSFKYLAARGSKSWALLSLLALAGACLLLFSGVMTNYGILIRFRAAVEILLSPFAVGGILRISGGRKKQSKPR